MPGTAVATGALADEGAGVIEAVALVDPALVVDAGVNVDAPSAATPVAGIEIRLGSSLVCPNRRDGTCGEEVVACDMTVALDTAADNWLGRFVSFR
jgi:hypothetical protein